MNLHSFLYIFKDTLYLSIGDISWRLTFISSLGFPTAIKINNAIAGYIRVLW